MKAPIVLTILLCWAFPADSGMIIGGDLSYIVRKGDTLERIGSRFGVDWQRMARENSIDAGKILKPGQQLNVTARRIVPLVVDDGIIINIPDRTLYYFRSGSLRQTFPVGLGKAPIKGGRDWSTPLGTFRITRKDEDPTWYVPVSIQEEMAMEGKPVQTVVPPGPENPLGRYSLRTSIPGILIHETIWPGTVYHFRSHGCIRVSPEHIGEFFGQVEINTSGEIIYIPAKAAVSDEGRVFLEVHRDVYGRIKDMKQEVQMLLEKAGVSSRVDREKVEKVLLEKAGVPEDVTR